MSVSVFKNGDALYTVILEDNKLHIYDHNTFNLFSITWKDGWDNILIWDTYLKRHIYI
jgi:hypothetical protein